MVELIPGTTLPIHTGPGGEQPEGRGDVTITADRMPRSLIEKLSPRDDISPTELAYLAAAIRAFDKERKLEQTVYQRAGGETDATTGNLVMPLYEVPQGREGHVANVTVDVISATITPAAPLANAAIFAFLAVAPPSTGTGSSAATVVALRRGLVAFAPVVAAGPVLPGQWTFNDTNAPVAWGGQMLYFVLVGGSVAAALALPIQATYRIDLYSRAGLGNF